jgi:hypothetical protein
MSEIIICKICTFVNEHDKDTCDICDNEIRISIDKIKKQRVDENKVFALQIIPMTFFQHSSLFLTCSINGFEFIALIDSGAQTTIMDHSLAEKCQILDIIDDEYQIKMIGIGESKTIGKIYCQDVMVGDNSIPMSFSILENCLLSGCCVIIGMDILNSHRSVLDVFNKTITFSEKTYDLITNRKEEI